MIKNLRTHIFIEFYYRNGKFLNEHNSKLSFKQLNETYGVFDGCEVLAKEIYNRIKTSNLRNNESKYITLKLKNHQWIYSIEVIVYNDENSNTGASYIPTSSNIYSSIRDDRKKFCPLTISFNLNSKNPIVNLMHELTHAYEDYNRQLKGKSSLSNKAVETGYIFNKSVGNYNNEKKYISFILYYLTDFEINAHLTHLKGELKTCNEHFVNIQQIVDFLRKTDICKRYSRIKDFIDFFSNITDKESQSIVLNWVSDLSSLKFRTYQHFIKYINNKYNKLEKHMNRIIPKIAYEYLNYGNTLVNFNGQLSEIK